MTNSNQKSKTSVGVGASSVLVIFVVLCLVTFSVLSLVSAKADKNLSDKGIRHQQEYYEAQNNAYIALEQVDKMLATAYLGGTEGYFDAVKTAFLQDEEITIEQPEGALLLSYNVFISDTQSLLVEVSVDTPTAPDDGFYTIKKWQTISTAEWHEDEQMPLLNKGDKFETPTI